MIERYSAAARQLEVPLATEAAQEYLFPTGILGFPNCHRYRLERFRPVDGGDSPFLLLRAAEQELTLPVIPPASVGLDYRFSVNAELLAALHAKSPTELTPLLIVTVRDRLTDVTLNMQGPLMVNPVALLGTQMVLENYPLRHPLLVNV